jgi:predicted site-specific integrase-resolvase
MDEAKLGRVVDEKGAAKLLDGMERQTLAKWRQRGLGPAFYRYGGKIRYRVSDIIAWLESRRVEPTKRSGRRKAAR